jgi:hypothetical protein
VTIQSVAALQRRYLQPSQLLTSNREVGHMLPVPENVTLFAKMGPMGVFYRRNRNPVDATGPGLLFICRDTTAILRHRPGSVVTIIEFGQSRSPRRYSLNNPCETLQ